MIYNLNMFIFVWLVFISDVFSADPTLKAAAMMDDHDLDPDTATSNLCLNTIDQNLDPTLTFEHLEPPSFSEEDYMFSLSQGEGISDLFDIDACDINL